MFAPADADSRVRSPKEDSAFKRAIPSPRPPSRGVKRPARRNCGVRRRSEAAVGSARHGFRRAVINESGDTRPRLDSLCCCAGTECSVLLNLWPSARCATRWLRTMGSGAWRHGKSATGTCISMKFDFEGLSGNSTCMSPTTRHQQAIYLDHDKARLLDELSRESRIPKAVLLREAVDDLLIKHRKLKPPRKKV